MQMNRYLRPFKLLKENKIKILSILILIFTPFLLSLGPEEKKAVKISNKQVHRMLLNGKHFLFELERIRRACDLLEKNYHGKKNCQKFSDEIIHEARFVQNSLLGLNHPFWAYLKGAAKYAEKCASCNKQKTKHYCPLFDQALARYNVFY